MHYGRTRAGPNPGRHLLTAQSSGHRTVPGQGRGGSQNAQSRGSQNAQRSYERYLALAQAQAQSGDVNGAENSYQHADHYFRLMSSNREST